MFLDDNQDDMAIGHKKKPQRPGFFHSRVVAVVSSLKKPLFTRDKTSKACFLNCDAAGVWPFP